MSTGESISENSPPCYQEVPFDFDTQEVSNENASILKTIERDQALIKALLNERFALDLQQNPLKQKAIIEVCKTTQDAIIENSSMPVTLDVRSRLLRSAAFQNTCRTELYLQSLVLTRIAKILSMPTIVVTDEYEARLANGLIENTDENVENTAIILRDLEESFAREVQSLWDLYGIVTSDELPVDITVHAQIPSSGLSLSEMSQSIGLHEEDSSDYFKNLLEVLRNEKVTDSISGIPLDNSISKTTTTTRNENIDRLISGDKNTILSYGNNSQASSHMISNRSSKRHSSVMEDENFICGGTIITGKYGAFRDLVNAGKINLIG